MADEKKILVIDDHFEMLEFLRSMLELSNADSEVLAVPSAEEGLLELRRMHFDLVITDVRLPGMSGFDLARQIKAIKSNTPIIMITAYSSDQGRHEAEDLGVFRYFPKPLDTDEMLTAVHKALYGESVVLEKLTAAALEGLEAQAAPNRLRKRLESLRTDMGATQLLLATTLGKVVLEVGNGRLPDTARLTAILAQHLEGSFSLAQELGSDEPFTLQYHSGGMMELYIANVGHNFFLAMIFDTQARRGRIGTIWVFAQRAIKELLELLPEVAADEREGGQTVELEKLQTAELVTAVTPPTTTPTDEEDHTPVHETEGQEWIDVEPEELAQLLASEAELLDDAGDLNSFWDEALAEADLAHTTRGFSLEEAQRQGLIPADLDFDDQPGEEG